MSQTAEDIIRGEWDLLKQTGLLTQIGGSAGPQKCKGIYNMFKWNALMFGPKNSPYNGYMFKFEIEFPTDYPNSAPRVFCRTPIYHMNINTDGKVCVASITNNNEWKKAGNISAVLLSIFMILNRPNPGSPYRDDIATLYKENREEYNRKVKEHCAQNAIPIS